MEIRITFTNETELANMISVLEANYKVLFVSKKYKNTRSKTPNEYRVYVKVEV